MDALRNLKGLNVRPSEQARFCFFSKTFREIIGIHTSPFVQWAGIMGDAKKVRLYRLHPYTPDLLVPYEHAELNEKI